MKVIVKYKNRKLYDKELHQYTDLVRVSELVVNKEPFIILDRYSKKDITSEVLMTVLGLGIIKLDEGTLREIIREGHVPRTRVNRAPNSVVHSGVPG